MERVSQPQFHMIASIDEANLLRIKRLEWNKSQGENSLASDGEKTEGRKPNLEQWRKQSVKDMMLS